MVKTLEKDVARLEKEVAATGDSLNQVIEKLLTADSDKATLERKHGELRASRQALLSQGGDVAAVTAEIRNCKDQLELAEDLALGLAAERESLTAKKKYSCAELESARVSLLQATLVELAKTYNQQAEALAITVKGMWEVRTKLRESPEYSAVAVSGAGWMRNALAIIPRLYFPPERPQNLYDETFFNVDFPKP